MPKKTFDCNKCGEAYARPIDSTCKMAIGSDSSDNSDSNACAQDNNALILQGLILVE